MKDFKKNPVANAALCFVGAAIGAALVIWIISMIKGTSLAEECDPVTIICCMIVAFGCAVGGYRKAKASAKE
jgi:hypothetical protein